MNLRILQFIRREAEEVWLRILLASVLSGLANGAVVVIVNASARAEYEFNVRFFFLFAICMAIYIVTFKYSYFQTAIVLRNAMAKTHLRIADQLRNAELLSFERIGQTRVYTTLSENSEIIFEASRMVTAAGSSIIMLFFTFGYIAVLSKTAFFMALILILLAVLVYTRNQKFINNLMSAAIQKESEFFSTMNHLLDGFKEIKMDRAKSDDLFHNHLGKIAFRVRDLRIRSEAKFLSNQIFGQVFWYFLVASIVFLLPKISQIGSEKIMSLTTVVLFIIGPISIVVGTIPLMVKANFAINQLDLLEKELASADDLEGTHPENPFPVPDGWKTIEFRNVGFSYPAPQDQGSFSVGPIDLRIVEGEILFLVGGNGSGKTTLLKLITGLYYPRQGTISMGGLAVTRATYQHYRNQMAAIFSDFHLFDRLYGLKEVDAARVKESLRSMDLLDKTAYVDGRFTNLNLSSGQKRRLALIAALMENKPILVIDELAADLDPEFRKYFYEVILVDLKASGKTIIATSHDDRYFHVADRVVKMEYGRINGD